MGREPPHGVWCEQMHRDDLPNEGLSEDEHEVLAVMELRLRAEDPELHEMFENPAAHLLPRHESAPHGRLARLVAAIVTAAALTAVITAVAGPEAGGMVGAVGFTLLGLYGWSLFGCPGRYL